MTAGGGFSGNPFPGLRPFEPDEEHLFFGREAQVDGLLSRLAQTRFVAVVGASGSGKSSLVRAGLLPALHGGFMSGSGSRWYVALMRPGRSPIAGLAGALRASGVLGEGSGDPELRVGLVRAVLERGALGLVEVVADARLGPGESLLVVVDQFEELFRFKAVDAVAFVKLLIAAIAQSRYPIYVVITMRSDFLGDVSQFRALPEAISESLFLVPRLTRAQFQRAIEGPIRVAGGSIAPRLINRLLNDLEDDADQLPVLQHALMRTWDAHNVHRAGEPLDVRDLEAIGALSQALSLHGDEVCAGLRSDRLRDVAEKVFKCLTDRGEDNRGVRRPTRFADVCAITDATPAEVREVAEAFRAPGCSFLMPPPAVPIDDDTVLDISHESLMRIWKRLQLWVDEEAQSAQIYRRLAGAAQLYREAKAALWRDPDLQIAVNWRDENHPTAAWGERIETGFQSSMHFLGDSVAERSRARRERTAAVRASLAALALVIVALAGLSAVAFSQWRIADASLRVERAERLADLSVQESARRAVPALLAADAYGMTKMPRTSGAMLEALMRLQILRGAAIASVTREVFAQRGRLLAVTTSPGANSRPDLVLFDALNLAAIARGPLGVARVAGLCGSPDSAWFAASDGHSILLYEGVEQGGLSLTGSWEAGDVDAMACLPGKRAVVVADARKGLRELDFRNATQQQLARLGGKHVAEIVTSPTGRFIATTSSGSSGADVELFDLRSLRIAPIDGARASCARECSAVAFSPDERRVAWIDGTSLRSAAVPSLANVTSSPCRCAGRSAPAYGLDGSGPLAIGATGRLAPVYDENTEVYVTYDGRSVAEHALDGTVAPALGSQRAPQWPGSFASVGSRLVLAGSNGIHTYDLDRYRSQLTTAGDVSSVVRVSDPGDGVHAVTFDYRNGLVRVMTLDPSVGVAGELRVQAPAVSHGSFVDEPQISYDPVERTLTEASTDGIARYAVSGRAIEQTPWNKVAAAATLPSWDPAFPYFLSSRGSYVGLLPPVTNQAPGAVPSSFAVVSTKGGLVGRFVSRPYVSIDERFATGLLASDSDTGPGLYRLPRADRLPGLDLPETPIAALSPDAETIAYVTGEGPPRNTDVQLFNVAANARIGPALPGPPEANSIENLAFSDNARYLIVTYGLRGARHVIVVFAADPVDWERTLCLWAGAGTERAERAAAERGIEAADACRKYDGETVP